MKLKETTEAIRGRLKINGDLGHLYRNDKSSEPQLLTVENEGTNAEDKATLQDESNADNKRRLEDNNVLVRRIQNDKKIRQARMKELAIR
jgi:hypothetical protein